MVMTFISFIHSFNFTVIYSFTCQLTHIFTLETYAKNALHAGSKKQVNEVEEGASLGFFLPTIVVTVSTSLGLEYDISGISQRCCLPTVAQSGQQNSSLSTQQK